MITTIFSIIGCIVLVMLLIISLLLCIYGLREQHNKIVLRKHEEHKNLVCREIGNELYSVHHWFSNSNEAMYAVKLISMYMMRYGDSGSRRIDQIREEWNNEISKSVTMK